MLRTGQIVGSRYRLEEPVGDGGMGCVWRATQLVLERPVAIKFLYARGPNPALQAERFLREARVAAAVEHRNVVDILDVGVTEQGQSYMVMSFLRGVTLADRLDKGPPLSVDELVRIVSLSLRGLHAVHRAGIVHRDLKPENVFLVEDPEGPYPRLLDFGISRILSSESGRRSPLTTREGVMVGTPQYMSPEQARGLRDLDERTDIYSMGVILYEALSGSLPFDSDAIGDLIIMIVSKEAPRLSQLRPEIGDALSDLVQRAMSKRREQRFASALEMQEALLTAAQQTTEALPQRPLSTRPRPGRSLFPPPVKIPKLILSQLGKQPKPQRPAPDFPHADTTRQLWQMESPPVEPQPEGWVDLEKTTLTVSRPPPDLPPETVPGRSGGRLAEAATRLRTQTARSVEGVRTYLATGSQTAVSMLKARRARTVAAGAVLVGMALAAVSLSMKGGADSRNQRSSPQTDMAASGDNASGQSIGGRADPGNGAASAAPALATDMEGQVGTAQSEAKTEPGRQASSGTSGTGMAAPKPSAPLDSSAGRAVRAAEMRAKGESESPSGPSPEARQSRPQSETANARSASRARRASSLSRRSARSRRAKARRRAHRTSERSRPAIQTAKQGDKPTAPVLRQPDY